MEVELEAVLPFAEADYPGRPGQPRPEFRPEEAATLGRLATQARQVVRLDGRYDDPRSRNHAYQQARDDEGLERLANLLLWAVLGLALVALVLKLLYQLRSGLAGAAGELDSTAALVLGMLEWLRIGEIGQLPFLFGAGAAILPAFIAAFAGIMFQSEARRLTTRSEAMFHALRARQREIDERMAILPGRAADESAVAWTAAQHLRALAEMTIEETGDWKVLFETHEIHAGWRRRSTGPWSEVSHAPRRFRQLLPTGPAYRQCGVPRARVPRGAMLDGSRGHRAGQGVDARHGH